MSQERTRQASLSSWGTKEIMSVNAFVFVAAVETCADRSSEGGSTT